MKNQSYSATIEVALSPKEVFTHLNDVSKWWGVVAGEIASEFEGQSTKLNDEFIIRFADMHYSKQKLIEVIPDKNVVWLVTESKLNWLENDKTEWTNLKMVFEITPKGSTTVLKFTHEGLVPEQECYSNCSLSWDMFIKDKLYNFMTAEAGNLLTT